ncbi:MAG: hypothetical protein J6X62_05895 [Bacteroidales bacterium]|nr:hypothetical protein [Bacteroidales bacterium]
MKASRILLFFAAVVLCLAMVAWLFPAEGVRVGNTTLRFPSLHRIFAGPEPEVNLDSINAAEEERQRQLAMFNDSVDYYSALLLEGPSRFWFPDGDSTFFDTLFRLLDTAAPSGRVVRIMHYGDSQIEMDRMTNRLRAAMQRTFGGSGAGMLPILQGMYCPAVNQHTRGDLALRICYGDSLELRANGNYGPMMRCFHLSGNASCSVSKSSHPAPDELVGSFSRVRLLVNSFEGLTATLTIKKTAYSELRQAEQPGVQMFEWRLDSAVTGASLSLAGNADIYGLLLDDSCGVAVDNIAMRGCSGQQFSMVNRGQLRDSYSHLDVGLIIMQFGGNSVPYIRTKESLETYCISLGRQIDLLHELCPQATILFVGPSDMSTTSGGDWCTYVYLPDIIDGLRETANSHGAAYWSIYHAMGGRNSMVAWYNASLAGADHLHFTPKGADQMGNQLADALLNAYRFYRFRNNQ